MHLIDDPFSSLPLSPLRRKTCEKAELHQVSRPCRLTTSFPLIGRVDELPYACWQVRLVVSWRCIGVFTNLRFMQTICPVFLPFDRMLSPSRITVLNANLRSGRTGTSPYLVTRKIADSLDLCHRGFTIARSAAFHLKSQSLSILLLRTCAPTSVLRTPRQLLASKCLPSDSHCSDPDKLLTPSLC